MRFIIFCSAHSLFASLRIKQRLGRMTGGKEPRAYRLTYNLASLIMFGWVMAPCHGSAVLYELQGPGRWALHFLQTVIAVAVFRCVHQTGSGDFLGISQLRSGIAAPHRLVTGGCYAHVRHPLYLYSTLFLALNPVMTVCWLLLTCLSVPYFIIGGLIEENRLLKEFGDEYRKYRQRVPFMIPRLKGTGILSD